MWYPATITVAPVSEPVSLAQVKAQLQIANADTSRDTGLNQLIAATRAHVETYCGIRLVTQTLAMPCDGFADFSRLPVAPIQSVVSIGVVGADGNNVTIDPGIYELRKEGLAPSIVLAHGKSWPAIRSGSRMTVNAVAGYATVPADIVAALLLLISKQNSFVRDDLLKRSESVDGVGSTQWAGAVEVSSAVEKAAYTLLEPYRNWPLA